MFLKTVSIIKLLAQKNNFKEVEIITNRVIYTYLLGVDKVSLF